MVVEKGFEVELLKEIYSRSYYAFFQDAFKLLHPGEEYDDNWHIEYLCNRLQQEYQRITERRQRTKDIIINMPFRSSKSMIVTVIFPVWCWSQNSQLKFICCSYADSLSLEHATRSRTLLQSEWFTTIYGDKFQLRSDENTKSFYTTNNFGYRKSVGTGGQITGSGSDIIILDDPQNPQKALSEVERKNTIEFYDYTLYSRLNQPNIGVRIIVMQRLHEQDLSGYLLESRPEDHEHICFPAEITAKTDTYISPKEIKKHYEDGLFWKSRFSKKQLMTYEKTLGSVQYAGQLQQLPAPEEGNIIKREWFPVIDGKLVERNEYENPIMFYIDTAETEKQEGDASAICVCFKKDNKIYITNVVEFRKEFHELLKYIPVFVTSNMYSKDSKIKVEPKTSGKSIVSQIKATTMLNIVELPAPKDDKTTRVKAVSVLIETGRVILINGNYVEKFLDQITTFPNARHDDMVDTVVYAISDLLMDGDFDFMFI